jgi:hypothetical protein
MTDGSLNNIGAWVAKKIPELVGMEEPDLVEFIMGHVRQHAPAGEDQGGALPCITALAAPSSCAVTPTHTRATTHNHAEHLESELSPILADDTTNFVMKLKRLIIYECERSALQQRFAT